MNEPTINGFVYLEGEVNCCTIACNIGYHVVKHKMVFWVVLRIGPILSFGCLASFCLGREYNHLEYHYSSGLISKDPFHLYKIIISC